MVVLLLVLPTINNNRFRGIVGKISRKTIQALKVKRALTCSKTGQIYINSR